MLLPGNWVEVIPAAEILQTLDSAQTLDGLPFMPEMVPFCGGKFRVAMRAERACVNPPQMPFRRLADCVVLEGLRCDGAAHGECELGCMILWKEAWLRPVESDGRQQVPGSDEPTPPLRVTRDPSGEHYFCQATELPNATAPGDRVWSPSQYLRFLRVRTFTPLELIGMFARPPLRRIARTLNHSLRPHSVPKAKDGITLGLQPGEWIEVRSRQEIAQTLDAKGTHKGLAFGGEMFAYCGRRARVLRPVERIIDESTGRLRRVDDTVALEGAACDRYLGCARGMPILWREVWLRRVEPDRAP